MSDYFIYYQRAGFPVEPLVFQPRSYCCVWVTPATAFDPPGLLDRLEAIKASVNEATKSEHSRLVENLRNHPEIGLRDFTFGDCIQIADSVYRYHPQGWILLGGTA